MEASKLEFFCATGISNFPEEVLRFSRNFEVLFKWATGLLRHKEGRKGK